MFIISSAAASSVGNVRDNNEDNFFINGQALSSDNIDICVTDVSGDGLYAVCDGMGGEEHGEVASAIAVNTLRKYYEKMPEQNLSSDKLIDLFTDEANAKICVEIEKNNGQRMGTTLAVLFIQDGIAHVYNIGDSRAYFFRNNQLTQLSQDHTRIKRLVDLGIISALKAKTHPERHKLTQHLGIFPDEMVIEPFAASPINIVDGDIFLLCSDGLTDMVEDEEIEMILKRNSQPQDAAKNLIEAALLNGGKDNVTVVVLKAEYK